jgi:hypothetical protein
LLSSSGKYGEGVLPSAAQPNPARKRINPNTAATRLIFYLTPETKSSNTN